MARREKTAAEKKKEREELLIGGGLLALFLLSRRAPAIPPGKGRILATAQADTTPVTASVTVVETGGTGTTPCSFDVDPGTYTVNGTYDTQTDSKTATVIAGETTTVVLQFVPAPPPPPGQGTLHVTALVDSTPTSGIFVEVLGQTPAVNGVTPWTVNLLAGSYFVQIKYMDQAQTKQVTIEAGKTTELQFQLVAEKWRISVSIDKTSATVGDDVTVSGKLEKQCPDGSWNEPNWDCIEKKHNDVDPRRYSVWAFPGTAIQHQTITDYYGNYGMTFTLSASGTFTVKVQAYVPDVGYVSKTDGTLTVSAGPLPTLTATLTSLDVYCDITPPQIIIHGKCLVDSNPAPGADIAITMYIDGVNKGAGSCGANGSVWGMIQYPPTGTHQIWFRARWFYEGPPWPYVDATSNKMTYTC